MNETNERNSLGAKPFTISLRQVGMQQFNRGGTVKIHVPAQVNIGKASTPQKLLQTIIAHLLAHPVDLVTHCSSPHNLSSRSDGYDCSLIDIRTWHHYSPIV